ncbi:hypothetical protein LMG18101_04886 [Ralstonia flaminis]|uniref:Uncharacterized protein n=1 Tax=Ralstonia flaminis TaxID=3058597 RepID=A0ABN9JRJ9_9RALS|nr:hypothetical protein LMG18101_04886 [Ralstonia sp. LMG 18101]
MDVPVLWVPCRATWVYRPLYEQRDNQRLAASAISHCDRHFAHHRPNRRQHLRHHHRHQLHGRHVRQVRRNQRHRLHRQQRYIDHGDVARWLGRRCRRDRDRHWWHQRYQRGRPVHLRCPANYWCNQRHRGARQYQQRDSAEHYRRRADQRDCLYTSNPRHGHRIGLEPHLHAQPIVFGHRYVCLYGHQRGRHVVAGHDHCHRIECDGYLCTVVARRRHGGHGL